MADSEQHVVLVTPDIEAARPWTYSKGSTAKTCPFAYHQQYRKKAKSKEPRSAISCIGDAVHYILELVAKGAKVSVAYEMALGKKPLTYEMTERVMMYREAIEDFRDRMAAFEAKFGLRGKYPEHKLAMTALYKPCGWWGKDALFRGIIDLLLITPQWHGIVLDHKAGEEIAIEERLPQLRVYSLGAFVAYPELKSVRPAVHYPGADPDKDGSRIRWGTALTRTHDLPILRREFETWLASAADATQKREAIKGWLCDYCGQRPVCPAY